MPIRAGGISKRTHAVLYSEAPKSAWEQEDRRWRRERDRRAAETADQRRVRDGARRATQTASERQATLQQKSMQKKGN